MRSSSTATQIQTLDDRPETEASFVSAETGRSMVVPELVALALAAALLLREYHRKGRADEVHRREIRKPDGSVVIEVDEVRYLGEGPLTKLLAAWGCHRRPRRRWRHRAEAPMSCGGTAAEVGPSSTGQVSLISRSGPAPILLSAVAARASAWKRRSRSPGLPRPRVAVLADHGDRAVPTSRSPCVARAAQRSGPRTTARTRSGYGRGVCFRDHVGGSGLNGPEA
jgi:hypothetical protein